MSNAFSTLKFPILVLRNPVKYAPQFNFFPRSRASARMYVPLLQATLILTKGKSNSSVSILLITIFFG